MTKNKISFDDSKKLFICFVEQLAVKNLKPIKYYETIIVLNDNVYDSKEMEVEKWNKLLSFFQSKNNLKFAHHKNKNIEVIKCYNKCLSRINYSDYGLENDDIF